MFENSPGSGGGLLGQPAQELGSIRQLESNPWDGADAKYKVLIWLDVSVFIGKALLNLSDSLLNRCDDFLGNEVFWQE